jgi:hypothetical protein
MLSRLKIASIASRSETGVRRSVRKHKNDIYRLVIIFEGDAAAVRMAAASFMYDGW